VEVLNKIWRRVSGNDPAPDGRRLGPNATALVPRPRSAPSAVGFAVVDVETTGLSTSRDRVVEVAVVATDLSGQIVDEWTTLVDPQGPVGATRIHGITAAEVRRAPRFGEIIGELNARFAGRALVAHNARFDLAFLASEYERAGWTMPACPHLCTLETSWAYLPELHRRRLADCCEQIGVPLTDAHCALADARASAALLRSYLASDAGHSGRPGHIRVPASAVHVEWPQIPRLPVEVAHRRATGPAPVPAPPGALAALLDDLPMSSAAEAGAATNTTAYLELLAQVLEDGVLTEDEAAALADLAGAYSLTRTQVEAAHQGFLLALAHRAVADGTVTRDERRELIATAGHLGLPEKVVKTVLDDARSALDDQRGRLCRPLPPGWPHGEPLRLGDGVAFTGCDDLVRARLEGRARAVGLRVTGSVSGKTAILVTDGSAPSTNKSAAARRLGTRIVHPDVFAELIEYVQPATTPRHGGRRPGTHPR